MEHDFVAGLKWYLVFLFSTVCHEAAHAWSAHRLGDDTAYRGGQVSLNPAAHVKREPLGMVVVPWLSYLAGGWMIGWASAPYNPQWAIRYPQRCALMALAGPAANWTLVLCAAVLMRLGFEWGVFQRGIDSGFLNVVVASGAPDGIWAFCASMLSLFFSLNLILGAFNLLPFPPLDGASVLLLFLPPSAAEKYWVALRQPVFSWLGLMIAWRVFGYVSPHLLSNASNLLYLTMPARG